MENISNEKKTNKKSIWVIILSIILVAYIIISFAVNIVNKNPNDNNSSITSSEVQKARVKRSVDDYNLLTLVQQSKQTVYSWDSDSEYGNLCVDFGFRNVQLKYDYDYIYGFEFDLYYKYYSIGSADIFDYENYEKHFNLNFNIFPYPRISDLKNNDNFYIEYKLYAEADDILYILYDIWIGDFDISVGVYDFSESKSIIITLPELLEPIFNIDEVYVARNDLSVYSTLNSLNGVNSEEYQLGYSVGYDIGLQDGIYDKETAVQDSYNEGYSAGYIAGGGVDIDEAYQTGYDEGFFEGNKKGYDLGYEKGSKDNITGNAFKRLFNLILNAPYNIFNGMFNFELFGVNLFSLFSFIFTTFIIIAVIKLFMK